MRKLKKAMGMIMTLVISASMLVAASANEQLPLRATFEEAGFTVEWQAEDASISAEIAGSRTVFHTRQPLAYLGDTPIPLQDGIELRDGRSYITQNDLFLTIAADRALYFMSQFTAGDILGIMQLMSPEMQAMGAEFFAAVYEMSLLQRGSFVDFRLADVQTLYGSAIFDFAVGSTIGQSIQRVSINAKGQVEGFFDIADFALMPIPAPQGAGFTAEAIIVGEGGDWPLAGLLTMPHGASADAPVPAVVLVHGSGPQNMDQSIFNNRPFHDIAAYLSSNGIAVLRYDKRTLAHGAAMVEEFGQDMQELTVWEETIDDAVLAAAMLQADARISSVFVAGNSLGGMLAPKIAEEGGLNGAILLAASPRALFEVQYDQNVQVINDMAAAGLLPQEETDGLLAMVAAMLEEARNLPNLTRAEMQDMLVFGIPALYHHSLMESLPLPVISRNQIPTLILHGDRDFQVWTDRDFQLFVDATAGYAHVQTTLYYGINHIFMQSQTDYNDLREYMVAGHVDEGVLRDIVNWIFAQ